MKTMKSLFQAAAMAAVGAGIACAAQAHVGASPKEAVAGSYQVVRFSVGHACAGASETTSLRLEIPEGTASARPQPKTGWSLAIEPGPAPDAAPKAITWTGRLPADQFEEFVVMMKLPDRPGPMAIPAVQGCGKIETRWVQPPSAPGGPRPEHPAPILTLSPAEHVHH